MQKVDACWSYMKKSSEEHGKLVSKKKKSS